MNAREGDWFSLTWELLDFCTVEAFSQWEERPRFLYAKDHTLRIDSPYIDEFFRLNLVSIHRTSVFISTDEGHKLPTHYRAGEFMPGDSPKYDVWLGQYHKINFEVLEKIKDKEALQQKKIFLAHTAKIIRHDMHSGINTYLPRALRSLLKKLPQKIIVQYKLEPAINMLNDGLKFTQKVYKGVHAFTSLVKEEGALEVEKVDVKKSLEEFLSDRAYKDNVEISDLGSMLVHRILFITAIDNLIRGGLKFNNSNPRWVKVFKESNNVLCIKDNGIGLSKEDFLTYCKPYASKKNKEKSPQGLELNIAVAIIEDHGFSILPEKLEMGTMFRIKLNRSEVHIGLDGERL